MRSLYTALPISPSLVARFVDRCLDLNSFLNSNTNLSIEEGVQLTYREILEIFVYGTYAHASKHHRVIYQGIRTSHFFPLFQTIVINAATALARCIQELRRINDLALQELGTRHA